MAFTASLAAAAVSIGTTAYGAYKQSKQKTPTLASLTPPNPAMDQAQADQAAANAGTVQKRKTAAKQGYASTILTGPSGTKPTVPPAGKTLLGS